MKAEKNKSMLLAGVLAFLLAFCAVGCMVTGMKMDAVSMPVVAGACALSAAVFCVCFTYKGSWVVLCMLALLGGYLWRRGPLSESTEHLLYHISCLYDAGYGWGTLFWSDADFTQTDMTLALCMMGFLVALAVTWAVVHRRYTAVGIVTAALPPAACLVLTDTVPAEGYLFGFLLGVLLLLLPYLVRRTDERQGNRLTVLLSLPVALALGLMFLFVPREGYDGQAGAEKLEQFVNSLFSVEEFPDAVRPDNAYQIADVSAEEVNLANAGPQRQRLDTVMRVKPTETGSLYLRGCAYDLYDGRGWQVSQGSWKLEADYAKSTEEVKTAEISTEGVHAIRYFTYTPTEGTHALESGRINNLRKETDYAVFYIPKTGYRYSWDYIEPDIASDKELLAQYLQLPEDTRQVAMQYIRQHIGNDEPVTSAGEVYRYANAIINLVRTSASYDLRTEKMPIATRDFAMWFLNESDTGYCMHFATAATVLLRAAGIPARYVTGYLVDARAGTSAVVKSKDAHAWVECYIYGVGWIMLEPTPSGGSSPVTEQTEPLQQTQPTEDTDVQPTQAQETTEPTVTVSATTEETVADQTTLPQITQPEPTQGQDQNAVMGGVDGPGSVQATNMVWLQVTLLAAAAVAIVAGQWQLRIWLRKKKRRQGTMNARALALWQEVERHARVRGTQPEEALLALAQKARFSQHSITREELKQFYDYLANSEKALRAYPVWHRLVHRLIFALY